MRCSCKLHLQIPVFAAFLLSLTCIFQFAMPLYTYIVAFKGATYAAQGSYSNFKGFVSSWSGSLPPNALPGLTPALRSELAQKAYRGEFVEVPNRKHVWKKSIDLGGEEFVVYAVQTQI